MSLTDGLISHWKFDETSVNNGYPLASANGGPDLVIGGADCQSVSGKFATAIARLAGSPKIGTEYGTLYADVSEGFTYGVWIKLPAGSFSGRSVITDDFGDVQRRTDGPTYAILGLHTDRWSTEVLHVPFDTWCFLLYWFDPETNLLYASIDDGTPITTASIFGHSYPFWDSKTTYNIGDRVWYGNYNYASLIDNNTFAPYNNDEYWEQLAPEATSNVNIWSYLGGGALDALSYWNRLLTEGEKSDLAGGLEYPWGESPPGPPPPFPATITANFSFTGDFATEYQLQFAGYGYLSDPLDGWLSVFPFGQDTPDREYWGCYTWVNDLGQETLPSLISGPCPMNPGSLAICAAHNASGQETPPGTVGWNLYIGLTPDPMPDLITDIPMKRQNTTPIAIGASFTEPDTLFTFDSGQADKPTTNNSGLEFSNAGCTWTTGPAPTTASFFPPWPRGSERTKLFLWQASVAHKIEITKDRAGDWDDAGNPGAKYFRGWLLRADTYNAVKTIGIRAKDDSSVRTQTVQHDGELTKAYPFLPPFVAHLVRYEPKDLVSWRNFGINWIKDDWPELLSDVSKWINLGTPGAKYLTGVVVPMETGGFPTVLKVISSDSGGVSLDSTTTAVNVKTPTAFAFSVPLIGHEFQIQPQSPCRLWIDEIKWNYEPWPEMTSEASLWMNPDGTKGAKYLRGLIIPMDTNGSPVVLRVYSPDGHYVTLASATTTAGAKTPVPFPITVPLIGKEFQIIPQSACRVWYGEIRWDFELWPEIITESGPWLNLGTNKNKYMRGCVIPMDTGGVPVTITLRSSDGGSVDLTANTTANVKTQVPYAFTVPLIGHEFQLVYPTGDVRVWFEELQYDYDEWPEMTPEASAWVNFGLPGAKYLRGLTIPLDTGGQSISLTLVSSDGSTLILGPFNTTNSEKTEVAWAITTPFIGHEFQVIPTAPCRVWWEETRAHFDPCPELIAEWSPWMSLGTTQTKYLRGLTVPVDTNGAPVVIKVVSSDGASITLPAVNTVARVKTPVSFAFAVPLIGHEFQFRPQSACRIWHEDAKWDFEPWPEMTAEATPWMNPNGTPGAKYMRAIIVPMDTNGSPVILKMYSPDGSSVTLPSTTTVAGAKTPIPFALTIPLIGKEFQIIPQSPCRIWFEEIRWDFDLWPELIDEATGWLTVLPGSGAAYLQGAVIPIETYGTVPALSLLCDDGSVVDLVPILTPVANIKSPVPYSLAVPHIVHDVQILPTAPCRIWIGEIHWFAQPVPELATTWKTLPTAHGLNGYHHIGRIEAAYAANADVTLTIVSFDGTSPDVITLPSTGGAYQKLQVNPTFNKGQLFSYYAVSAAPFQLYLNDWIVWLGMWGRTEGYIQYRLLGGEFGDKAPI